MMLLHLQVYLNADDDDDEDDEDDDDGYDDDGLLEQLTKC